MSLLTKAEGCSRLAVALLNGGMGLEMLLPPDGNTQYATRSGSWGLVVTLIIVASIVYQEFKKMYGERRHLVRVLADEIRARDRFADQLTKSTRQLAETESDLKQARKKRDELDTLYQQTERETALLKEKLNEAQRPTILKVPSDEHDAVIKSMWTSFVGDAKRWDALSNLSPKAEDPTTWVGEGGRTLLHYAARYERAGPLRYMLNAGAAADQQFTDATAWPGATPLHYAACHGKDLSVSMLLEAGASREHVSTSNGKTLNAADWARYSDKEEIARIIEDYTDPAVSFTPETSFSGDSRERLHAQARAKTKEMLSKRE